MKSVRRTVRSDRRPEITLGMFIGLSVLAVGPLAVGVAMLTIRHLSLRDMQAAKTGDLSGAGLDAAALLKGRPALQSLMVQLDPDLLGQLWRAESIQA